MELVVINKVRQAVSRYNMLDCSSVLVGFSGGADSSALLDILNGLCKEKSIALYALHVNHMIRGDEADRDEKYCREFCLERGIPFHVVREDVVALSRRWGMGVEECARKVRYDAFSRFCKENGVEKIATAHNANDNEETVIFNLIRGTGIRGLSGIPPVRDNIIRPLLYCEKREIVEYCRQMGIKYMNDSSNDGDDYVRNRIRHKVTPLLETVNPHSTASVLQTSTIMRGELEALDFAAGTYIDSDYESLRTIPEALLKRVLVLRMERAGFNPSALEYKHFSMLTGLFLDGKTGDKISLPGKCQCIRTKDGVTFINEIRETEGFSGEYPLSCGENVIEPLDCIIEICKDGKINEKNRSTYNSVLKTEIFFDNINDIDRLYVRGYRDGDRYVMGGMTRRVRKLLWQAGVPSHKRERYPIICDEKGPLILPGFSPRDDHRRKKDVSFVVIVYLYNKENEIDQPEG